MFSMTIGIASTLTAPITPTAIMTPNSRARSSYDLASVDAQAWCASIRIDTPRYITSSQAMR